MNKEKGFTLLEILTVVVIISLLSTIIIAGYREGERQFALKRSAHQLAQSLRKAQEMALSSQEFMGIPQGGYGISLKEGSDKYVLFIDCNNNNQFDNGNVCRDCSSGECFGYVSDKIEEFTLEELIKVETLTPYPGEDNSLSVVFLPPDPETVFNPESDFASIKLNFENGPGKMIYINKVGLIEIE